MNALIVNFGPLFDVSGIHQMVVTDETPGRLLLACVLGAVVGLEREVNRKAAGVRTNLLICMGSAFFTMLSAVMAGAMTPDKSRIASNIVQGIGFLGAGVILHNRSRISGLTSAASIWVVASIGMACGLGLYAAATIGALLVIVALELVGFLERGANLKGFPLIYEARGSDQTEMLQSILDAMDKTGERLTEVERDTIGTLQRVSFVLTATRKQHQRLRSQLVAEPAIDALHTFRDPEDD